MTKKKSQKTPWNRKAARRAWSFSDVFGLILLSATVGYFIYDLSSGYNRKRLLDSTGVVTQAVVIDDKNYRGNSPVSRTFSYSYSFEIDGEQYIGDTRDTKCSPGQIVKIKYVPGHPSFNEMVKAK